MYQLLIHFYCAKVILLSLCLLLILVTFKDLFFFSSIESFVILFSQSLFILLVDIFLDLLISFNCTDILQLICITVVIIHVISIDLVFLPNFYMLLFTEFRGTLGI